MYQSLLRQSSHPPSDRCRGKRWTWFGEKSTKVSFHRQPSQPSSAMQASTSSMLLRRATYGLTRSPSCSCESSTSLMAAASHAASLHHVRHATSKAKQPARQSGNSFKKASSGPSEAGGDRTDKVKQVSSCCIRSSILPGGHE